MNRVARIVVIVGLGCMPISGAGFAQAPSAEPTPAPAEVAPDQQATKEQLTRLFEVMRLRQQFDNMMKVMPQMVQQQIQEQMKDMLAAAPNAKELTPKQQATLDKLMETYMKKALSIYPIDEMIDDAAGVYQRHMSRPDVDAYIAFYSSPAGQRLLDAQPVILREYMPMAMKRVQSRSRELSAQMARDVHQFIATEMQESAPGAKGAPSTQQPAAK